MQLYLDIDGVLLTTKNVQKAEFADEFIKFIVPNFDCYWLTTHCKGNSKTTLNYLTPYFDKKTLLLLEKIKPTNWNTLKTEAIDFSSDFVWLDDNPMSSEINILNNKNKQTYLLKVDLTNNNELSRVIKAIKKLT